MAHQLLEAWNDFEVDMVQILENMIKLLNLNLMELWWLQCSWQSVMYQRNSSSATDLA